MFIYNSYQLHFLPSAGGNDGIYTCERLNWSAPKWSDWSTRRNICRNNRLLHCSRQRLHACFYLFIRECGKRRQELITARSLGVVRRCTYQGNADFASSLFKTSG